MQCINRAVGMGNNSNSSDSKDNDDGMKVYHNKNK